MFVKENETVPLKNFGDYFKACGLSLSHDQLEEWRDEVDNGDGAFTWEAVQPVFVRKLKRDNEEKELKEAFRVLDKKKEGCIDVADLRWILRSLGDDLTDEEIEDMITETDADGSGLSVFLTMFTNCSLLSYFCFRNRRL